jgi:hypothetical protein
MISNSGGRQEKLTPHMTLTNSLTLKKLLCTGIPKLKKKTRAEPKQIPANGYTTNCHLSWNGITRKPLHGNPNVQQCFLEITLPLSNHFVTFYQITTQQRR